MQTHRQAPRPLGASRTRLPAPVLSLCAFVPPSGCPENAPSCPGPKHRRLLPSGKDNHRNPPPRAEDRGAESVFERGLYSPALGQDISPHHLLPGLLPPPTLPPTQDSPRDLSESQTQYCLSLLRTIHGSPVPSKSKLLATACKSLGGLAPGGPSASLSTPDPHPHPEICGQQSTRPNCF